METLIHADIFFFVATIALVIVTIVLVIALVYAIKILVIVRKLSETVRTEADLLVGDIEHLRAKASGWSWNVAFRLFKSLFKR